MLSVELELTEFLAFSSALGKRLWLAALTSRTQHLGVLQLQASGPQSERARRLHTARHSRSVKDSEVKFRVR